jgi:MFS family permease
MVATDEYTPIYIIILIYITSFIHSYIIYISMTILSHPRVTGIPGCVPWSVVQAFLNDYLAQDHKMGVRAATMVVSAFGVGGLLGGVLGGIAGQLLRNRTRRRNVALFMAFTVYLSIPPLLYLVDVEYTEEGFNRQMAVAFIGGIVATSTGSNIVSLFV